MEVLHDEQDRRRLGERLEQRPQRLEDAQLGRLPWRPVRAQAGEDRVEGGAERRGELLERVVGVAHERAQGRQERRIGQLVDAELDAVAREHARAGFARVPDQLLGEPRLADAGLTANQCERWSGGGRVAQRGLKLGELSCSADEAGARHACGHRQRILPPGAARVPCSRGGNGYRWR
jgi:hypothetical protein